MIDRFEKHGEQGRPEGTVEVPCTEETAAQVERLLGLLPIGTFHAIGHAAGTLRPV